MNKKQNKPEMQYHVTVTRRDEAHATAQARQHTLSLNIKKGDGDAGFNAAETLLAALGACILTNVNSIAAKMRLQIDEARIEFEATRCDEPPALTRISYRLIVRSPEPEEKLRQLHQLAVKWGTVTNTLINGLEPAGTLAIKPE
ncbi:MAG: OsmC family peroxiredoxin [Chloroflexi bacterium]|nr:MAG: OsmC family peroxiredoxin [Chloroflexota bacterium]